MDAEQAREVAEQLECPVELLGVLPELLVDFEELGSDAEVAIDLLRRAGIGPGARVLDVDDWDDADALLDGAGLVLLSVPIAVTLEVIARLKVRVPADALLADVTSVKAAPLQAMLDVHPGPVLGLHPMFGPTVATFRRQKVVVCPVRRGPLSDWLLGELGALGMELVHSGLVGISLQSSRYTLMRV